MNPKFTKLINVMAFVSTNLFYASNYHLNLFVASLSLFLIATGFNQFSFLSQILPLVSLLIKSSSVVQMPQFAFCCSSLIFRWGRNWIDAGPRKMSWRVDGFTTNIKFKFLMYPLRCWRCFDWIVLLGGQKSVTPRVVSGIRFGVN